MTVASWEQAAALVLWAGCAVSASLAWICPGDWYSTWSPCTGGRGVALVLATVPHLLLACPELNPALEPVTMN